MCVACGRAQTDDKKLSLLFVVNFGGRKQIQTLKKTTSARQSGSDAFYFQITIQDRLCQKETSLPN